MKTTTTLVCLVLVALINDILGATLIQQLRATFFLGMSAFVFIGLVEWRNRRDTNRRRLELFPRQRVLL